MARNLWFCSRNFAFGRALTTLFFTLTLFKEGEITCEKFLQVSNALGCLFVGIGDFVHSNNDFQNFRMEQSCGVGSNDTRNERARTSPIGNEKYFGVTLTLN